MSVETVPDKAGRNMAPANPKPCKDCPWRASNQGKPHPHGFFTKKNLQRLWAGLRRGERMTCHPTDPQMAEFAGYEGTAERHVTHECAGAQILIQRELQHVNDACERADAEGLGNGIALYRREHSRGLTKEGIAAHISDMMFGGSFFGGMRPARANLNRTEVQYPPLGEWEAR